VTFAGEPGIRPGRIDAVSGVPGIRYPATLPDCTGNGTEGKARLTNLRQRDRDIWTTIIAPDERAGYSASTASVVLASPTMVAQGWLGRSRT